MTDKTAREKLASLINVALAHGFDFDECHDATDPTGYLLVGRYVGVHDNCSIKSIDSRGSIWYMPGQVLVFNHDFARALFGRFPTYVHDGFSRYSIGNDIRSRLNPRIPAKEAIRDISFGTGAISYESWQYYLQQAVISEDPIDYMYNIVKGTK